MVFYTNKPKGTYPQAYKYFNNTRACLGIKRNYLRFPAALLCSIT